MRVFLVVNTFHRMRINIVPARNPVGFRGGGARGRFDFFSPFCFGNIFLQVFKTVDDSDLPFFGDLRQKSRIAFARR